jgi:hypothetical protein
MKVSKAVIPNENPFGGKSMPDGAEHWDAYDRKSANWQTKLHRLHQAAI